MRGLPLRKETVFVLEEKEERFEKKKKKKKGVILEPKSVLDQRSPSPPTSTSTLSSSLGRTASRFTDTAGVAAISDKTAFKWPNAGDQEGERKEEWTSPVPASLEMEWETILSESTALPLQQEHTFLRWIMGDIEDDPNRQQHPMLSYSNSMVEFDTGTIGLLDPNLGYASASATGDKNPTFPLSMPPVMFYQEEPTEEKPQFIDSSSNLLFNQFHQTQAPVNPGIPLFSSSMENLLLPSRGGAGSDPFLRQQPNQSLNYPHLHAVSVPYSSLQHRGVKPKKCFSAEDQVMDQLMKVSELIEAGNLVSANGILARLNHQLPSAIGKPFLRSAFYFKEALQLLVNSTNPQVATSSPHHRPTPFTSPLETPLDVVLKLSAYKAFSEVSPILQFINFTAIQALLEELGTADCIHIIDFDIGVGGQWSSFMQELSSQRRSSSSSPISLLKITAFVSPYAFHPLELHLTKENLSHFAADLNIPFEINIASVETFDPAEILVLSAGSNEAIAVNLPVGVWQGPFFPTLLRLVKQLLPKIVISMDQGCDRGDLLFSHYLLHSLQSCVLLLDSFDAAGTEQDVTNKIERFVLQPRIENSLIGRASEKMLPWRTLFASAGFVPFQFSNYTETQAECLLKRVQVRGFHLQKRQATLYLYWQRGELASVSAWRCSTV